VRWLVITAGSAAAWFLPGHFALLAVLVCIWASAVATTNTAKARTTEQRVNSVVAAQGVTNASVTTQSNRVDGLSGHATSTGQPPGQPTGPPSNNSTSTNGISSPGIVGTSGGASAGTAHTHGPGSYVVGSGQHSHDLQNHAHDYQGHTHNLPNV
jgi:hypothetical protein